MFKDQVILVTGGTGSWGYELIRQLLPQDPKEIIIYSRGEAAQVAMSRTFHDERLTFRIGDIRDKEALITACQNVDIVYHLAALKHVPICEEQPAEALKTNVVGTQNVIEAAIKNKVKKVLYISTDKASNPSNFYGMTKAIGEKLVVYANLIQDETRFVCIRGGNVLGTNGSVIHLFKQQIREQKRVKITDLEMTRFFLTMPEAIQLLFKASRESIGGEIFVMLMPTCRIIDLAEVLIEASGIPDVSIEVTGIRPGERIHELLLSEYESRSTVVYDKEYLVIMPALEIAGLRDRYGHLPLVPYGELSSEHELMSKEEIRNMLDKGGFLS
ncbi:MULTISPECIES: polysaccharide biosynthesis protein [Paenibacillus]|jgi:FlaA1/EpsC-like NDP-sugar epimerase|uniref:Predicted nucleoside-diphosphate sugar epimerases n=1 Tax=Paenibacillus barengoltzii J12 TaxID=935846 RepID=A0ABY1M1Y5_9BACL|nr:MULTISPECIES: polysaccharide biosynthesis protein [Paenibacillus]MEC2343360.1 polysaccharide biosynthesis protein [Paenibacillus barengoltzii]SMF57007.1 Predicted nucleoside-diphosphate sugar epimerases [Paenibacillus barengoltzii J12]SMF58462.1 Predicted nucleoside-diphosphate sugar epimerases [Paenibacillus barengoltzii]